MIKLLILINLFTMPIYELPKLPYELDALEPQISQETMEYHYLKHHKAYVDKLNELIAGTEYENMPLEQVIVESDGPLFNNAAQTWNHTFFFYGLSPNPKSRPEGPLAEAIDRDFGSFEQMRELFAKAAAGQFGSGWAWLSMDDEGMLHVTSTPNAENPLRHGMLPLATLDVWEHAYYIDYRNRRPDFISKAWERIDWGVVEQRYADIRR